MEEAYKVGLCNNTMLDGSVNPREQDFAESERNKLSPYRALYLATLGGARAIYLDECIGNFLPGKEADFICLDVEAGQHALAWHQQLTCASGLPSTVHEAAELLFGVLACGDDRNVEETWVAGECRYRDEHEVH
jgi:guanine deaminase